MSISIQINRLILICLFSLISLFTSVTFFSNSSPSSPSSSSPLYLPVHVGCDSISWSQQETGTVFILAGPQVIQLLLILAERCFELYSASHQKSDIADGYYSDGIFSGLWLLKLHETLFPPFMTILLMYFLQACFRTSRLWRLKYSKF